MEKMIKRATSLVLILAVILSMTFVTVDNTYAASRIKTPVITGVYDVNDEYLEVNWTKRSSAQLYNVYRSNSKNGKYYLIGATRKTRFNDDEVIVDKTYYYKVKAIAKRTKYNSYMSKPKSGEIPYMDDWNVTFYLENSNVPDFGSFMGISHDHIIRNASAVGYCYTYDDIKNANSRYDWAVEAYSFALQSIYNFTYEEQLGSGGDITLIYSLKQGGKTIQVAVAQNNTQKLVCVAFDTF